MMAAVWCAYVFPVLVFSVSSFLLTCWNGLSLRRTRTGSLGWQGVVTGVWVRGAGYIAACVGNACVYLDGVIFACEDSQPTLMKQLAGC